MDYLYVCKEVFLEATIVAKSLQEVAYFSFSLPLSPYNVGSLCNYALRYGKPKQPNCFPSSLVIIFFGPVVEKKCEVKFPEIYFVWFIRRKSSKMKFLSSCFGKDCICTHNGLIEHVR